jgi:mono/diheme cytochrome c family protein
MCAAAPAWPPCNVLEFMKFFGIRYRICSRGSHCKKLMAVFVLASCAQLSVAAAQTQTPSDKTPGNAAARGRSQFSKSCAFCHGANATGGPEGPNLTQSSVVRHDKGGDLIGPVIREGRPGRGMPPIPLQTDHLRTGTIADRRRRPWKSILQWPRTLLAVPLPDRRPGRYCE